MSPRPPSPTAPSLMLPVPTGQPIPSRARLSKEQRGPSHGLPQHPAPLASFLPAHGNGPAQSTWRPLPSWGPRQAAQKGPIPAHIPHPTVLGRETESELPRALPGFLGVCQRVWTLLSSKELGDPRGSQRSTRHRQTDRHEHEARASRLRVIHPFGASVSASVKWE